MRRIRISKSSKKNYVIVFALVVMILTVGYATFAQPLAHRLATMLPEGFNYGLWYGGNRNAAEAYTNINVNNNVNNGQVTKQTTLASNQQSTSESQNKVWDVGFVAAKVLSSTGNARELSPVTFDRFRGNFAVKLGKPGDEIVYEFTIQNLGMLDAKVNNIEVASTDNNEAIIFDVEGLEIGDSLDVGKSAKIMVKVKYKSDADEVVNINKASIMIAIQYVQK